MLKNWNKGPWDVKGKFCAEDVTAMNAIETFYNDRIRMENEVQNKGGSGQQQQSKQTGNIRREVRRQ